jgi:hypothetical protein
MPEIGNREEGAAFGEGADCFSESQLGFGIRAGFAKLLPAPAPSIPATSLRNKQEEGRRVGLGMGQDGE